MGQAQVQLGANIKTIDGVPFVGSNIPTFGNYIGQRIQVTNPAVPSGRSYLAWSGTIWVPPAGEIIVSTSSNTSSPLVQITPGNTNLTQVWASPIIPDYMIPNFLQMEIVGNFGVANSSGISGALLAIGLSGSTPTKTGGDDYPLAVTTKPIVIPVGISSGTHGRRHIQRRDSIFNHQNGYTGQATGISYASGGNYVSDNNRLYAMCKASGVADTFIFEHATIYSRGNL